MKTPPNTKKTTAEFKLKILTNRNLNYSGSALEQAGMTQTINYVNGHQPSPKYLIEDMLPMSNTDIVLDNTIAKAIDGEYTNDQAQALAAGQTPLDFTYNFGAKLGNPVTQETYIELVFPTEFNIVLKTDKILRNAQLSCTTTCGGATWDLDDTVYEVANWNGLGKTKKTLKIRNLFKNYLEQGYQISFGLSGWSHTVGEQCDSFIILTKWDTGGQTYLLDHMSSLLLQQSSLRAVDCVVKA